MQPGLNGVELAIRYANRSLLACIPAAARPSWQSNQTMNVLGVPIVWEAEHDHVPALGRELLIDDEGCAIASSTGF